MAVFFDRINWQKLSGHYYVENLLKIEYKLCKFSGKNNEENVVSLTQG